MKLVNSSLSHGFFCLELSLKSSFCILNRFFSLELLAANEILCFFELSSLFVENLRSKDLHLSNLMLAFFKFQLSLDLLVSMQSKSVINVNRLKRF